jgi:hypothetical protein
MTTTATTATMTTTMTVMTTIATMADIAVAITATSNQHGPAACGEASGGSERLPEF